MKKMKLRVTVELEVTGHVAEAVSDLRADRREKYPLLNGASYGAKPYDIACLGVRSVRPMSSKQFNRSTKSARRAGKGK